MAKYVRTYYTVHILYVLVHLSLLSFPFVGSSEFFAAFTQADFKAFERVCYICSDDVCQTTTYLKNKSSHCLQLFHSKRRYLLFSFRSHRAAKLPFLTLLLCLYEKFDSKNKSSISICDTSKFM